MAGLTLIGWLGIVTVAFPSDLEIAFATVSGKVGHSTNKTAGCIIVWSTGSEKTQNIYCRYELEKNEIFQRDDDKEGAAMLRLSDDKVDFQKNIENWFKNKDLNPTPTELPSFADVMSRLLYPNTHYFVLKEESALTDYKKFAEAVHKLIKEKIKEKIPEKVIEEAKAVATEVQNNGEVAKKEVENAAEQAKIDINKIVADATTTAKKPATDLELSFIYISISLFYMLFILFFLASRKTTSQLKNSDVLLETNINDNVSTLSQEIAHLKTQNKILQENTLPERLSEMQEQLRSELEEKITPLSPVKESRIENKPSSENSLSYYLNKNRQLEGDKRQLEIELQEAQSVIGRLEREKRDLAERQRSEQDKYKKG